eukprot:4949856-Pyramimonas_sp.AAC.1
MLRLWSRSAPLCRHRRQTSRNDRSRQQCVNSSAAKRPAPTTSQQSTGRHLQTRLEGRSGSQT